VKGWSKAVGYAAAVAILLGGWALLSWSLNSPAMPSPLAVFSAFAEMFRDVLVPETIVSAWRVVASVTLGMLFGVPLGLMLGRSPAADAVFAPLVFLSYPVPKAVFFPVLLVLLGIGNVSIITLIAMIVFFQILVTARDASRAVAPGSVLSVRSLGASRLQVFRHVVVPASMPEIFTALKISSGTAIAVLFFSETWAGSSGLGYVIADAWGRVAYAEMFAAVLAMALLGVALYELIEFAERRVCRWTRAGR
jgi:ABC-type nitrate/sulfonate/bicarbonate transport system permease component